MAFMSASPGGSAVAQSNAVDDNPLAEIYRLVAEDFEHVNALIPLRLTYL